MVFRELNDLPQADWLMLHMQSMSLLPCIYIAGLRSLEIPAACFRVSLKPFTFPSSTCIDLLWGYFLYDICAAAECLKYSRHCVTISIGSSKSLYLLAAAAIIYNYSNNQQQKLSRSILPRPNTLTLSYVMI